MSAYVIFRIDILDAEKLKAYQQVAPDIVQKYEGKFLVRGGEMVAFEGPKESRRIVIVEFPNLEQAKKFYNSEEYQRAIELREGAAVFEAVGIEGLA